MNSTKIPLLSILFLFTLTSCINDFNPTQNLVGTWIQTATIEDSVILNSDKSCDVLDSKGNSTLYVGSRFNNKVACSYEVITEVTPHQLYFTFGKGSRKIRKPFGIFKLDGNKMIVRNVAEIHRFSYGVDMGLVREEWPADFNGPLKVYVKMR